MPDDAALRGSLPAARAAVLARLWGALVREPIDGLGSRETSGDQVIVKLPDGRALRGDQLAGQLFAPGAPGLVVRLDGTPFDDPAALVRALGLPGQVDRFAAELENSVRNLALARAAQPAADGGAPLLVRAVDAPDPLAVFEQSVVDGHPVHPGCRTRLGLSTAEVLAYGPEHRPVVALPVVEVPADRWVGVNAPPRLLMHPWQHERAAAGLRDTGERVLARPLMSLRTLALVDDPRQHVKTAVDVQMTSAVRIVSPAAIHNGPIVSTLLAGLLVPGLTVVPEVASGAVLVDGAPSRSLAMLRRRLPPLAADELALPLAALAAPSPADGRPLILECVDAGNRVGAGHGDGLAWLRQLAAVMLPPLLRLLDLGVALEAHGQNLLLVVSRSGWPVRLLYRDLGGVRLSPARLASHGVESPPLQGDLVTDDPLELRTKLVAAAVSTVLAEVVNLLSAWLGTDATAAWREIAAVVHSMSTVDSMALLREPLPIKAMTAMRLSNEPLSDQWTLLPNPMEGL